MNYTFKGNFGTLELVVDDNGNASGIYQKGGTLAGTYKEGEFEGAWENKGMDGLVKFTVSEGTLTGRWKKGKDAGPMRGNWEGEQIGVQSQEDEVEVLIYGPGIKITYGCMDLENYLILEEHGDGYLENILWDSDRLYELTKEKYLSMYELDNSQSWQGADLDAYIKITVNNEIIVNDRFNEVFDIKKVSDYSKRDGPYFGTENYIRFTKKPAAKATIIGNSNIKGEIIKSNFKTEEAFDIENFKFLILDAEYEGYSKFVESIYYKGKFIDHWGNSSYDERGWTFNVSKPILQIKDVQSNKTCLKIALSFDFAHEIENISDLSIEFEERKEKLVEAINMLDDKFGMSQKSRYLDNIGTCYENIYSYLRSIPVLEKVESEEWDDDFHFLITTDRASDDSIDGIEDFEDDWDQLIFKNMEVSANITVLDEDLLTISEDFYIEAKDEGNDLYASYNLGEHVSGNL